MHTKYVHWDWAIGIGILGKVNGVAALLQGQGLSQVVNGQYKMMQMHMPHVVGEMNVHQLKTLHSLQVVSCNNRQQSAYIVQFSKLFVLRYCSNFIFI